MINKSIHMIEELQELCEFGQAAGYVINSTKMGKEYKTILSNNGKQIDTFTTEDQKENDKKIKLWSDRYQIPHDKVHLVKSNKH